MQQDRLEYVIAFSVAERTRLPQNACQKYLPGAPPISRTCAELERVESEIGTGDILHTADVRAEAHTTAGSRTEGVRSVYNVGSHSVRDMGFRNVPEVQLTHLFIMDRNFAAGARTLDFSTFENLVGETGK